MNEDDRPELTSANPSGPAPGAPTPPASPPPPKLPETLSLTATFDALLKHPAALVERMLGGGDTSRIVRNLLVTAAACLAIFGFVLGTHQGETQFWAAPLKVTGGAFAACLICLPSLYIFSCLTGIDIRLPAVAGLMSSVLCLIALLLLGFTPVVWIFAQSTQSIPFLGFLALAFWAVATLFGLGLLTRTATRFGVQSKPHLFVWFGIFVLVTLQMTTALRPIIGKADTLLPDERKFFLEHWSEELGVATAARPTTRSSRQPAPPTAEPDRTRFP